MDVEKHCPLWCGGDHEGTDPHVSEWEGWEDPDEVGHLLIRDVGTDGGRAYVDVALSDYDSGDEAVLRVPLSRVSEMAREFLRALGYPFDT